MDIDDEKTKNYGVNEYQPHLMYYNNTAVNERNEPDVEYRPNFFATLKTSFCLEIDEFCFEGHTLRYFRKFPEHKLAEHFSCFFLINSQQ